MRSSSAAPSTRCGTSPQSSPSATTHEVKARWWKAFDEARSPGEATRELQGIIADYRTAYPSAMAVIETDLPALVSHLRFPSEHRKRITDHESP